MWLALLQYWLYCGSLEQSPQYLWGMPILQRRQWQPTPVLLPGKSHGWRSLVGYSPQGCEESDTTEWLHFYFHALEKEMATHSSVLAWRIPRMAEPGGLPSMGLHRVRHNWSDLAAAACLYLFLSHKQVTAEMIKSMTAGYRNHAFKSHVITGSCIYIYSDQKQINLKSPNVWQLNRLVSLKDNYKKNN